MKINYIIENQKEINLRKRISKMNMEELDNFLNNKCKTKEDRINFLAKINNNHYCELSEKYKDIKNLPNIILENGKKITLDFDYLELNDDFTFEHPFTLITKEKKAYQQNICCTTKEMIYYRINEYFKEYPVIEDIISNKTKNENIKKELVKLSILKEELLSYIKKQKTTYKEFNQGIENRITGVYSIEINDYQNNTYKDMLTDLEVTENLLNKRLNQNIRIATQKYHLLKDLKYYLKNNYNYQKAILEEDIKILKTEIEEFDVYKDGLSQKKQDLQNLKDKLKFIPKDGATKMEQFLNSDSLDLKIDSKNQCKYDTKYISLNMIVED